MSNSPHTSVLTFPKPHHTPGPDAQNPALARWWRRPALLWWGWAALLFVTYAGFAARRHALMRSSGYDLGIFEQMVRGYAELQAPLVPLRGTNFNGLGDHFDPIVALIAPPYALWP